MSICFVITTYNRKELLQKAVDSILPQLLPADRLLLVDDFSEDDTQAYANALQETEQSVIYHRMPENSGINAVRQKAIDIVAEKSNCQWLSFVDDDDTVSLDIRELMSKAQRQYPTQQWIAFPSINPDAELLSVFPGEGEYSYIEDYMGKRAIRGDFQHFIATDIAKECQFTQVFRNAEEWYFWIQICQKSSWLILETPGVTKQYLEEGLSKTRVNKERALQAAQLKADALNGIMSDEFYSKILRNLGKQLVKAKRGREARAVLQQAIVKNLTNLNAYKYWLLSWF